jgi:predicted nucleic acid-binding protein
MLALDADLLAYAVNRFAPEHARAAPVVEALVNGERPWALPWPAVYEALRLVTHPHAVARPLGPDDAWGVIAALSASPALHFLGATERHAEVCAEVLALRDRDPRPAGPTPGSLDSSFSTAVLLREHGVRDLLSTDAGMRRWRFLDVRDPIQGEPWTPGAPPIRRYRTLSRRRGPLVR